MQTRARGFTFTLNNFTDEELEQLDRKLLLFEDGDCIGCNAQVSYLICGSEVGSKKHTHHLQGYVRFHNAKKFKQVKKMLGDRAHIEIAKGTPQQNRAYCSKDEDYIEYGELPAQGARNDIKEVVTKIKNNEKLEDILMSASGYQAARHAELLYKYNMQKQPPYQERYVKWIVTEYAITGLMKAIEKEEDYYLAPIDLQHWDGYTGQKTIIVNVNEDPKGFILRLISGLPTQLNTKGSIRWVQPTTTRIVVTTRKVPLLFYDKGFNAVDIPFMIDEFIDLNEPRDRPPQARENPTEAEALVGFPNAIGGGSPL